MVRQPTKNLLSLYYRPYLFVNDELNFLSKIYFFFTGSKKYGFSEPNVYGCNFCLKHNARCTIFLIIGCTDRTVKSAE